MTNLDSILKSRDVTLPTKVCLVKAMVFPVIMYGCESWTIKKAKCWRIDAFELWCLRRLLRVPWTARRSSQSILKEISPEYSLGGLMLKLKLQYFGHLMWRTDSLEKTLMLGKIERQEEKGMTEDEMVGWHHQLNGHEFEQALGVGIGQGGLACCSSWGHRVGHNWMTELTWTRPQLIGKTWVCWRGPSALLSSAVQMLISSDNTFMDTSLSPAIWANPPVKLTHKINCPVIVFGGD